MKNTNGHELHTNSHELKTRMGTNICRLICLFLTASLCLSHSLVWAEPKITGAPSAIQHKQSITISGANFGVKENTTPAIWDDFEWGKVGDPLTDNGWMIPSTPGYGATLSSTQKYSGAKSAYAKCLGPTENTSNWQSMDKTINPTLTMYVSFMVYWYTEGEYKPDAGGFKASRINSDVRYSGEPALKMAAQPQYDWYYAGVLDGAGGGFQGDLNSFDLGQWHRIEYLMILSDPPGADNGYANVWIDLKDRPRGGWPFRGITRASGVTNKLNIFMSPHMWCRPPIPYVEIWADDIYVDTTQARVEIGNAPTFDTCTIREIQIPVAWSDNSITFTANQGSFQDGEQVYLYVVDENGNVNEQGYPITFVSGGLLGDINQDGKVDIKDLILVAKDFGKTTGFNPGCDLNGDARVDIKDLIIVAKNFGRRQ